MKNLKVIYLSLLCVLSFHLFSQNSVTTTPTNPFICNGTATLDTTNVDTLSIIWQEIAALPTVLPSAVTTLTNLCEGSYMVTFEINGILTTENFTISTPFCTITASISGTNPLDIVSCNGSASVVPTSGTAPFTYFWYGDANGETISSISNLCPGTYCCLIMDANSCSTDNLCIDLLSPTPSGDTLIINGGSSCLPTTSAIMVVMEDCWLDYDAVDTAYITNIILPTNTLDSTLCTWSVVDTTGFTTNYSVYYTYMNSACYDLQLMIYCYQKSSNVKTLILTQGMYLDFVSLNELSENKKQIVSVVDLLGRETTIEPNQLLIYTYSDGAKEKKFINE